MSEISLKELDSKIDKLTEMVRVLSLMVNDKNKHERKPLPDTTEKVLIKLNKNKLSNISSPLLGTFTPSESKFITSIIHSQYKTVTDKQFSIITSILAKYNYDSSEIVMV